MMLSIPCGYAAVPILVLPPIMCACGFSSALIQQRNTLLPSQSMSTIHPHPFSHTCPALPCPACLALPASHVYRMLDARIPSLHSVPFYSNPTRACHAAPHSAVIPLLVAASCRAVPGLAVEASHACVDHDAQNSIMRVLPKGKSKGVISNVRVVGRGL
ncbi:hypothetical protein IWZ03DRAFT_192714 [Phyllosticta citriasiana]|uniref:Uncharacterized protein n=1 Tax=Phyllosticta citriasiana TaxID=595635 RepID=A0ABR1KM96_9PEZI